MARVLIAEDDTDLADTWSRGLQEDGHDVTVVYSGTEAVEKIKETKFDVIITDVIMPGTGGIVVTGMARLHLDNTKVIAVSGYLNDMAGLAKLDFLKNLGVKNILQKPVDLNNLSSLVSKLAEEKP